MGVGAGASGPTQWSPGLQTLVISGLPGGQGFADLPGHTHLRSGHMCTSGKVPEKAPMALLRPLEPNSQDRVFLHF